KFATDAQQQTRSPGDAQVDTATPNHQRHDHDLADQNQQRAQHRPVPYRQDGQGFDQHADAYEEESEQDIAKWTDTRLDLMAKLGFTEHHAGKKSPECE